MSNGVNAANGGTLEKVARQTEGGLWYKVFDLC